MSDGLRTTLPSPSLAVIVPTIGRPELANLLSALAPQTTAADRVLVVCDRPRRYDWCCALVEGLRKQGAQGRWTTWDRDNLGHYGHAARNEALDFLASLEQRPDWVWSIDDDDLCAPDALDVIRAAVEGEEGGWYAFQMVGGEDSHFAGVTIPNRGHYVLAGNIGTPCIVTPVSCVSRFGLSVRKDLGREWEPGYWGDLEMAVALRGEIGDPVWVERVIATVRPSPAVTAILAPSSAPSSTIGSAGTTARSSQISPRA
jgi:hypothetical protein